MNDFFIKPTAGGDDLPAVLPFSQYLSNLVGNQITEENANRYGISKSEAGNRYDSDRLKGTIAGNSLQFTFEFRHESIDENDETDNIKSILNMLKRVTNRSGSILPASMTIGKSFLKNRFIILSIPDYGFQTMSAYYRDFVPHIYHDGRKVWQRYVGIIKSYTMKREWLLIDRDHAADYGITDENVDGFIVRVCFKNAIENSVDGRYSIEANADESPKANGVSTKSFRFVTNFNFMNKNDLRDYDVMVDGRKTESGRFYMSVDSGGSTYDIAKQSESVFSGRSVDDYFRQRYENEYGDTEKEFYDRPLAERRLDVSMRCIDDSSSRMSLESKQNLNEAFYLDDASKIRSLMASARISSLKNISAYDKNGYRIFPENGSFPINEECEAIADYSNARKFIWRETGDNSKTTKNAILAMSHIFPWNMKDPFAMQFKKNENGKYVLASIENSLAENDGGILEMIESYDIDDSLPMSAAAGSAYVEDILDMDEHAKIGNDIESVPFGDIFSETAYPAENASSPIYTISPDAKIMLYDTDAVGVMDDSSKIMHFGLGEIPSKSDGRYPDMTISEDALLAHVDKIKSAENDREAIAADIDANGDGRRAMMMEVSNAISRLIPRENEYASSKSGSDEITEDEIAGNSIISINMGDSFDGDLPFEITENGNAIGSMSIPKADDGRYYLLDFGKIFSGVSIKLRSPAMTISMS